LPPGNLLSAGTQLRSKVANAARMMKATLPPVIMMIAKPVRINDGQNENNQAGDK
jgi:hypothetical protein